MSKPSIRVERDALCIYVSNVRVVAVGTQSISIGERHIVIGKDGVATETIAVGGLGAFRISTDGTGEISIAALNPSLASISGRIKFSTRTGAIEQIHFQLSREESILGVKLAAALECTLRPLSFNGQMLFHGDHSAKVTAFGKTILSHSRSGPLGLHDSIDALSLLSAGYLDPTENPNIKAFLERLKRTKDGDLPGLSSLSAHEVAALLTLLKAKSPDTMAAVQLAAKAAD
jgi:hypothetical protein